MGHNIHHATYPENINKKPVQAEWDEYAAREDWQEGCSGLPSNIRWINHVCNSMEDAEKYIRDHDTGWYDQFAVKFKDTDSITTTSSKKETLLKQIASYKDKKKVFDMEHSLANLKSEYISCPKCRSKLARQYIGRSNSRFHNEGCPVCGETDIRAPYIHDQLKSFQDKIDKWQQQLKEEELYLAKKVSSKVKIKWLVKIEYHT